MVRHAEPDEEGVEVRLEAVEVEHDVRPGCPAERVDGPIPAAQPLPQLRLVALGEPPLEVVPGTLDVLGGLVRLAARPFDEAAVVLPVGRVELAVPAVPRADVRVEGVADRRRDDEPSPFGGILERAVEGAGIDQLRERRVLARDEQLAVGPVHLLLRQESGPEVLPQDATGRGAAGVRSHDEKEAEVACEEGHRSPGW